jgi:hypothetical protein
MADHNISSYRQLQSSYMARVQAYTRGTLKRTPLVWQVGGLVHSGRHLQGGGLLLLYAGPTALELAPVWCTHFLRIT